MRPKGRPEELEARRLRAIALLSQGHKPVEVARMVGVDRRSVRRWKAAYLKNGYRAIRAKPAGRPPKLDEKAKRKLESKLLKGAQAAGFPTDLWTCPRVAKLIFIYFGIRYHVDHIGRLLRSMGFSPQRPQRRAIERDEEEIQRWVKKEWPRIKKSSTIRCLSNFFGRDRNVDGPSGSAELGTSWSDTCFAPTHEPSQKGLCDCSHMYCAYTG